MVRLLRYKEGGIHNEVAYKRGDSRVSGLHETIAYAKYKIGSVYHKAKIESVDVTEEGLVEISFKIETAITGAATVTEIQLYDTNNNLWLSKQESLKMDSVAEGFYYVCQLEISEREVEV